MKTRLNESIRDATLCAVLEHRFKPQREELAKEEIAIGELVYAACFTAAQRTQMRKAPEGWFSHSQQVRFTVSGQYHAFPLACERPVPFLWTKYEGRPSFALDDAVGLRVVAYTKAMAKHDDDKLKARMAVRDTLKSFRYVEDLVKSWPEIKKFIPKDAAAAATVALALPPQRLNEMLGLA